MGVAGVSLLPDLAGNLESVCGVGLKRQTQIEGDAHAALQLIHEQHRTGRYVENNAELGDALTPAVLDLARRRLLRR